MVSLEVLGTPPVEISRLQLLADSICHNEDPCNRYSICIKLVVSDEMQEYNRQYRGCNKATDILSFITCEMPLGRDSHYQHERFCDIIIDTNQLALQKGNRIYSEEFLIVLTHGLLHLVGYDHIRRNEANKMETKENYYQELIKVKE